MSDTIQPTRRHFLQAGAACLAGSGLSPAAEPLAPELNLAVANLESYFTPPAEFGDVSRGKPAPHTLSAGQKRAVGLTRATWKLEVVADPEQPASLERPLTRKAGTALDFHGLLELAAKHTVRFPKVMTCLNLGCPLGMGIWEGIPLREVIWLTRPRENLRRVFYYGYHNDDPPQMFRSSLPIGRVLEDPFDWPPVILCYKLNGRWLDSQRGGPVRLVVPEGYGFKSVKWLTHVVLTNLYHANDTYALANNDIDSPLKTFADTLTVPTELKAGTPIPITGYAQVGISGLSKVQVWIHPSAKPWPADDPYFARAPWRDAQVLPPPAHWGGNLPGDKIPDSTLGFENGRPRTWPMRLCKVHWAALLPGLPAGEYTLRCRSVDEKGQAQPMPRPFRKSGRCAIAATKIMVKAN
ncbi:MAG TPA: molybdopterin-dependent oxidoreductase [Gemmataceae bacterium]|nr:molybdopterin-dependent oxidoreductase [Gemmataceae bacterium]